MLRTGQQVCGGGWWWWVVVLKPITVLSLDKAEQKDNQSGKLMRFFFIFSHILKNLTFFPPL